VKSKIKLKLVVNRIRGGLSKANVIIYGVNAFFVRREINNTIFDSIIGRIIEANLVESHGERCKSQEGPARVLF
jgi:hypothetical protein